MNDTRFRKEGTFSSGDQIFRWIINEHPHRSPLPYAVWVYEQREDGHFNLIYPAHIPKNTDPFNGCSTKQDAFELIYHVILTALKDEFAPYPRKED